MLASADAIVMSRLIFYWAIMIQLQNTRFELASATNIAKWDNIY